MPHAATAEPLFETPYGASTAQQVDERERAKALIFALASAEQTLEILSPSLKRALGYERRPLDRAPGIVRTETRIALREARKLVAQLELAAANLSGGAA